MANYVLHYTSADGPGDDATWSVYREEYATFENDEPIDGSQQFVSTHANEDAANAEAERLQHTPEMRLNYLRSRIHAENISWGELAELQSLADHIADGDVELLEWAGVSEEDARNEGRI